MKHALQLCSLALNPNAPSPTASMVKLEDGRMTSFGGLFCVSVPQPIEVGACFNPALVSTFFRKERTAVAYTIRNGKLIMKEGKESLSVPSLPPEEMVTLDVLDSPEEVDLDLTYVKHAADVINPINYRVWAQGISFRYGMLEATDNYVVASALSGLPDEMEFNLPVDAAKALLKFKSKVVSVGLDERAVKFYFKDGSTLTSLIITEQMPDTSRFFEGEWTKLNLKDTDDIIRIPCSTVKFKDGSLAYLQDNSSGVIEGVVNSKVHFMVGKENLDRLLRVSPDVRVSEDGCRLMAVADKCRMICTNRTPD